jgi:hypothetical protein
MTHDKISKSNCQCPEGYDDLYQCTECDVCCFDWDTFTDKYADYLLGVNVLNVL